MKHKERQAWWWYIISNDPQYNFKKLMELETSFFELSFGEIARLGHYATIFHINPKNGKSPARHLWDEINENFPF